jgi:hypothetical protein
MVLTVAIMLKGVCSGSRVSFQIWESAQMYPENHKKIQKKKEMVHTVADNAQVMFSGSRADFQIRKLICFYSKNCQKIRNNVQNVRYSF